MKSSRQPFTCIQCLLRQGQQQQQRHAIASRPRQVARSLHHTAPCLRFSSSSPARNSSSSASASPSPPPQSNTFAPRPTTAPRPIIDIKHIRQNPDLHRQNCLDRNYRASAESPARINTLFAEWQARQHEGRALRERGNLLRRQLANPATTRDDADEEAAGFRDLGLAELRAEARGVKASLAAVEAAEAALQAEMEALALAMPNLTSGATPRGDEPRVLGYINEHPEAAAKEAAGSDSDRVWRSHVHVGAELGLLDFAGAAAASGWGWYYLVGEGAQLEQALVSYALAAASRGGWRQVSPPSMVYAHVAAACGFQPRDANGETQIYAVAQDADDAARGKPARCLAATAEIPLAGMKADATLDEAALPARAVAVSRCYRAEAGARGSDTKGLYRVHEFTKVELFAWTAPDEESATAAWDDIVDLQTDLLGALGLHCRVLEMPTADLGASATRKCDIEAFFPGRRDRNGGWGEVTSASICTDYQTRRLATRLKTRDGRTVFPYTVNGTALAVPRVLAALLENGWDEAERTVAIPEVLRPWMGGREKIGLESHHRLW